jgi:GTP pyrophosphokinase
VPLKTPLRTGDIVEILTSPNRSPSRDWLNIVVSPRAKHKIRHWLNIQQTAQATDFGRRMFERELKRFRLNPKKIIDGGEFRALLSNEGLAKAEDLYVKLGFGKTTISQVMARLLPEEQLAQPPAPPGKIRQAIERWLPGGGPGPIMVRGHGDLLAFPAKCCRPVPGEEIVGYITRGRGVSVHSVDCPNVRNLLYNPEREIEVEWAASDKGFYPISLLIETEDRPGMLAKLTEAIARLDTNIRQIEADTERPGRGNIEVVIEVTNRTHLERIRQAIRNLPGVLEVTRRMAGGARAGDGAAGS